MYGLLSRLAAKFVSGALRLLVALLTGVRPKFEGELPFAPEKNVYFANHSSHADFVLVSIALPKRWRRAAQPVAGADYWLQTPFKRFIGQQVFNALMIMRKGNDAKAVTAQMGEALQQGTSLIVFPEGTRNMDENVRLQPFKSGIYHLAAENPDVNFIPVWLENIGRVLPKGKILPVPMRCDVRIGEPVRLQQGESKEAFLARTHQALLALADNGKAA